MSVRLPALEPRALFHDIDTRMNIGELDNLPNDVKNASYPDLEEIKKTALAIGCLMTSRELVEIEQNGKKKYKLSFFVSNLSTRVSRSPIRHGRSEIFNAPLAPNEKFRTEWAPGFGSFIFIGKDKIITAGHCVCQSGNSRLLTKTEMDKIRVVFRYHKKGAQDKDTFKEKDVFKIKEVVQFSYKHKDSTVPDWALIKLDRKVAHIQPIEIQHEIPLGREVYAVGCPYGTAVKCSGIGFAKVKKVTEKLIESDVDILGGNSGGAFIDRTTHKVFAITIRGYRDYTLDKAHFDLTGNKQVISFRVTQDMINNEGYGYSEGQRITPEMCDLYRMTAKQDRKLRVKDSNDNSLVFHKGLSSWVKNVKDLHGNTKIRGIVSIVFGTILLPLMPVLVPIGVRLKKKAENPVRAIKDRVGLIQTRIETTQRKYGYSVNSKEANLISSIDSDVSEEEKKRIAEVAKNQCAYNIPFEMAEKVQQLETAFDQRYSPKMILGLLQYGEKNGVVFASDTEQTLKSMHIKNPNGKYISVHEARVKAWVKIIKKREKYENCSITDIESVARSMVDRKLPFSKKAFRKEWKLAHPINT